MNPLFGGGDPFTLHAPDGKYYTVCSHNSELDDHVLYVYCSDRLSEPGVAHAVWRTPAQGWNAGTIWAPELHCLNGKYYVYYTSAACEGNVEAWATRRLGVLEADAPLGPYVDGGMLKLDDEMAIDGTVFEDRQGNLFLAYMRNRRFADGLNTLCIAPMDSPTSVCGAPCLLSGPSAPWEEFVNEGPFAIRHEGKLMLVFSANATHFPDYCLALLTCEDEDHILSQASWRKSALPVFQKGNGVLGPGHCSITESPDGSTPYLVYHCKSNAVSDFSRSESMWRAVCVQPFAWDREGRPAFGEPVAPGQPQRLPPGEKPDAEGKGLRNAIRTDNECLIGYNADGVLRIVDDVLYLNSLNQPEYGAKAVVRGLRWGNAAYAVNLRMPNGEGAGILLDATQIGARRHLAHGYWARLHPRFGLQICRLDGDGIVMLAQEPFNARYGDWVELRVTTENGRIEATTGARAVTATDDTYGGGRAGLMCDQCFAVFRDFRITAQG